MKKLALLLALTFAVSALPSTAAPKVTAPITPVEQETLPPMTYEEARNLLIATFGYNNYVFLSTVVGADPVTAAQYIVENQPFTGFAQFLCVYTNGAFCLPGED